MFAKPSSSSYQNLMAQAVLRGGLSAPTTSPAAQFFIPPPGEIDPARDGVSVPIGNAGHDLSNYEGNKFTRGWLNGEGGADVDMALGSTAFNIAPATYNNTTYSDFRAVCPEFGAPVPGLANWDVNAPGRTFNPLGEARAEWIPSTWSHEMEGLNVMTGLVAPRVFTALDPITASPTPQFFALAQMQSGADAQPSYGNFWERPEQKKIKNAMASALKKSANGVFAAGRAPSMKLRA